MMPGKPSSSMGSKQTVLSPDYPEESKLLLQALFGDDFEGLVEVRLLCRGLPPIQLFYPSVTVIDWELIRDKNSGGIMFILAFVCEKRRGAISLP